MENAVQHKIDEKERENIKDKVKKLLDDFSNKLEKIKISSDIEKSKSDRRDEGNSWNTNEEFKSTMFSNAPDVRDDSIIAEKGGWK